MFQWTGHPASPSSGDAAKLFKLPEIPSKSSASTWTICTAFTIIAVDPFVVNVAGLRSPLEVSLHNSPLALTSLLYRPFVTRLYISKATKSNFFFLTSLVPLLKLCGLFYPLSKDLCRPEWSELPYSFIKSALYLRWYCTREIALWALRTLRSAESWKSEHYLYILVYKVIRLITLASEPRVWKAVWLIRLIISPIHWLYIRFMERVCSISRCMRFITTRALECSMNHIEVKYARNTFSTYSRQNFI